MFRSPAFRCYALVIARKFSRYVPHMAPTMSASYTTHVYHTILHTPASHLEPQAARPEQVPLRDLACGCECMGIQLRVSSCEGASTSMRPALAPPYTSACLTHRTHQRAKGMPRSHSSLCAHRHLWPPSYTTITRGCTLGSYSLYRLLRASTKGECLPT